MFHLVYKITNSLNSKYYIGVHSTSNIDDGYMGSGQALKHAIKKHGVANFQREVLYTFDSREDALLKEEELVTFETLSDPLCYNLILGGVNGCKTTKEKRELFSTFARPINTPIPFDSEYQYEAKLKYPVSIGNPECLTVFGKGFYEILVDGTILKIITECYNDKLRHPLALKFIDYVHRWEAFRGNLYLLKIPVNHG